MTTEGVLFWFSKRSAELSNAAQQGAGWALVFWVTHEYLGHEWPTWVDAVAFIVLAMAFSGVAAGGAWLARRRNPERGCVS